MPEKDVPGKRRRGHLNGTQSQITSIYASTILEIVRENPGLNISEIARELPKKREEIIRSLKISPELSKKLRPLGPGDLRKTVRKHLTKMLGYGQVRWINGYYYPRESAESKELIASVDDTILKVEPQNWSWPLVEDAVIFRTYVNPASSRYQFDEFFGKQMQDFFKNDLFFVDQFLEQTIGTGRLSPKFYNPVNGSINLRMLREGWWGYFTDAKAIVWMYAINPTFLRQFFETTTGQKLLKERLAANWGKILARGRKRLAETRAMQRKLKKIKALQAKQEASQTPNTAGSQGVIPS